MRQGRKGENAIGVEAERRSKERGLTFLGLQHYSPCGWKFNRKFDKVVLGDPRVPEDRKDYETTAREWKSSESFSMEGERGQFVF